MKLNSDCRFYETLIRKIEKKSNAPIDLYLTHGGGKGAFATLAKAYRSLSVKTAVISDLDLLRNKVEFKNTLQALGGDPAGIEPALYDSRLGPERTETHHLNS